ncbi:MAG: histidinol-phosphate transaminase [Saprospiraceae bacterium]|nr:histidinol-phosphate transaminase [Saprospiraceae bacterium]
MTIKHLVRPNILQMKPYSSARDEFKGTASVFLDANENPFPNNGLNRYPDPVATAVRETLAMRKNIPAENIFLGNGSDEVIDVLIRVFCEPRIDNIITLPPTYGMYEVSANTADVEVRKIALTLDFQPKVDDILRGADGHTKILFLCSPNNPTGNSFKKELILELLAKFNGIIAVDEAYIDFSSEPSCSRWLTYYPNLVIMQTFSKAWGLAGIRLGMAFASTEIIGLMNKVKPPYNVNELTQRTALNALKKTSKTTATVAEILVEREKLSKILRGLPLVKNVYPTDANFLLVKVEQPNELYNWLAASGIVVRNRNNVVLCEGCLRITVGTAEENTALVKALKDAHSYA